MELGRDVGPGASTSPCVSHLPVPRVFFLPRQLDEEQGNCLESQGQGVESEGGWTEEDGAVDGVPVGSEAVLRSWLYLCLQVRCCLFACRGCICPAGRAGDTGRGELRFSEDRHFVWTPEGRSQQDWWLRLERVGRQSGSYQAVWLGWGDGRGEQGSPCCRVGITGFLCREEDITCQIWRRWLEAGLQGIRVGQSRQQMPGAEEGLKAYREKGERELKILQTTGTEKVF